ncbi:MAG: biotin--[acetyl-CoA-carboxylase] ligase [Candidatus Cloacimonetes bacterium]|jgi:BirA family biotin operon repressor/biotin-[acetyl-CoA-carboxylase] ligase|nr:biotin--[acetyl-CoA-carboxylase] ligase [Candidatus Cloacimonadota bacterium]MCB5286644.1 biotin--[acetyl-CoA-carboxylase] ligase [Candidatus Cloacimonadota bacterium]MCK9183830.1 biotin--[acetyl-CoA-carboxylase] ligase [Candidatus Cloacimonadota bacterium]MCK9584026.1 biotin--[acetyl-CoA-carboxylase] ligase [Candidatus Cloacimonadota bacterium]MDY0228964.1 biotin--[acetyl-CoA-carboxylase] ligase [Candidatus Cloacimonadaceae bacterium]
MTERSYFYYDELDSTMQEHKRLQDCCDGLICVRTGTQDDGKGRGEKIWLSPPEGLWFTFDLKNTEVVPSFSLFIGYCLHRELSRLFAPLQGELSIKWTNDIMYKGKKLGGILCKNHPGRYIIGIGINTNNVIDPDLGKFGAISLKQIMNCDISNEQLCYSLIEAVESQEKVLSHSITYITYCNEQLFGRNSMAVIDVGTNPFEAEILGIDLTGALIIRKSKGEIVNLHSGSILSLQAFS